MRKEQLLTLAAGSASRIQKSCGVLLVLAVLSGSALAGGGPPPLPGVPEIDPGSMLSALALFSGGVMILTDRRRRS